MPSLKQCTKHLEQYAKHHELIDGIFALPFYIRKEIWFWKAKPHLWKTPLVFAFV